MIDVYFVGLFFISVIMLFWSLGVTDDYDDLINMKNSNLLHINEIKKEYEYKQLSFGCFWIFNMLRFIYLFLLIFTSQWFLILLFLLFMYIVGKLPLKPYNNKKTLSKFFAVIWFVASIFFIINHYHINYFPF